MSNSLQPLVSVVIPVYNQRAEFLRECMDSVVNQTYKNIEIVISNNHSTNETKEVLASYIDPRIRVVIPPNHLPLTPHFQWASEQATGEYLTFLPSDDWLEKECIEELVGLIHSHPNVVMAFCSVKQYYNGQKAHFIQLKPGLSPSQDELLAYVKMTKLKGWMIGCLFRKSIYDKVGGINNGELNFTSDRWLFIQMAMYGDSAYSDKPYGIFRNENPERKSRMLLYSRDVVKVYQLIEEKCLSKIPDGKKIVQREKNKMAFGFLRELPAMVRAGDVNREELFEILGNLKKIASSRVNKFIIRLYGKEVSILPFSILFYFEIKYRNARSKIKNLLVK